MNLTPIRANMTEFKIGNYLVLFSYQTPVAVRVLDTGNYYKTEKKWSRTTTRHINQWLGSLTAQEMPQEYFDNLLSEVK